MLKKGLKVECIQERGSTRCPLLKNHKTFSIYFENLKIVYFDTIFLFKLLKFILYF